MQPSIDTHPDYFFWHEPGRSLPFRWALKRVPSAYQRRHGTHHGGATTPEGAQVAAERHAMAVQAGADL